MKKRTDREILSAAGEAIYGPRFQRDLAAGLDVNERTVRRWIVGDTPIPDGTLESVAQLITKRINTLSELVKACTA